jgi:hypothetical protein
MNEHGIEEMMMVTVNVIVIERKIGTAIGNAKVIGIGTVTATEENATEVNVGLGREIVEAVIGTEIGIAEVVIGIMTANEIGSERGKFLASTSN